MCVSTANQAIGMDRPSPEIVSDDAVLTSQHVHLGKWVLAFSISVVAAAIATALDFFGGFGDDFVKDGFLIAVVFAKHTAESLDRLTPAGHAPQNDRHFDF